MKFADYLAKSTIVPKDFANNPGNILVAIQWGMELGLQPMQAMQNIAVINGRPALWGDAVIALVRSSPLCEYIYESDDGETATCRVKRVGEEEQSRTFSMTDATQAGLKGKQGPWAQYPKRMRQMRARAFALRDVFADVLRGMPVAEEVRDTPTEREIGPTREPEAAKTLSAYPDEKLAENLPKWRAAIEANKTTPEKVIGTVTSKYTLTAAQAETINQLKPLEGVAE
nr:hypothetical protein [Pseudomonas corrugata]